VLYETTASTYLWIYVNQKQPLQQVYQPAQILPSNFQLRQLENLSACQFFLILRYF